MPMMRLLHGGSKHNGNFYPKILKYLLHLAGWLSYQKGYPAREWRPMKNG
jgi:hypothetical protein